MRRIAIRTLERMERGELRTLVAGYVSSEAYRVRKFESRGRVVLRLDRALRGRPFRKRFPLSQEEWARYREVMQEGSSLGAYDGGKLVGVALAERREWNRSLWVWEIGVAATHRRRGIGSALIRELTRRARASGLRVLVCETQTTNVPAIDFYRRNGFTLDGIDLSYYTNRDTERGEVAVFMKKRITGRGGPRKGSRTKGPHTSK